MGSLVSRLAARSAAVATVAVAATAVAVPVYAGTVTQTASDAAGASSFTSGVNFGGAAPSSGNNYFTAGFQLRSPADAATYTFGGASLSIDPDLGAGTASPTRFLLKGIGTLAAPSVLNIANLILNGGDMEQAANNAGTETVINGAITLATGTTSGLDSSVLAPGIVTLLVNSPISGSGNLIINRFQASDAATVVLAGANTFTGTTSVANVTSGSTSTLQLSNSLALQNSTLVNGGTTFTQILGGANLGTGGKIAFDSSVASHAFTLGGLTGTSGLALSDNAATPNAVTLSVGNNNTSNTYSGVLSGAGNLIKIGTGSETLSGTSTYTGGTTVSGGKLIAAAAAALGTGGVTLNGGTLSQTVSFSTGAISVNTGTSFLDFGGLSNITDTFSGAGTFAGGLDVLGYNSAAGDVFNISGTALTPAQLANIVFINPNGLTGNYAASQSGAQIMFVSSAAPEPSALLLALPGALMLGGMVLRRKPVVGGS